MERLTWSLFTARGVQWVVTWDEQTGLYELRSRASVLRWERWKAPDGQVLYRIHSLTGPNPIPSVDPTALRTLEEEVTAAGGAHREVPHARTSYPDLLRRLTQLFDHRNAPDLVFIPRGGGDLTHPGGGAHGSPGITQSRAPLVMAGPGIAPGSFTDALASAVDIAPTVAHLLGVRPVVGTNAAGVPRQQLMRWQDGTPLLGGLAGARDGARLYGAAQRAVIFVVDGTPQPMIQDEIKRGNLPNIARLVRAGTTFRNGSLAEYPTVTWANHNAIVTGASPGHTGILNNSWYSRATGEHQLITDARAAGILRTGRLMERQVETLYEAVERSFPHAQTVAINQPSGRGADTSILDLVGLGDVLRSAGRVVRNYLAELRNPVPPVLAADAEYTEHVWKDNFAAAYGRELMERPTPPKLAVFQFAINDHIGHYRGPQSDRMRAAIRETDRRLGGVLAALDKRGLTDSTLFVLTSDHGMEVQPADQRTSGGWSKALRASGVRSLESNRFVYLRSMRYSVHGPAPRAGVRSQLAVRVVNDDQRTDGVRPALPNGRVRLADAAGNVWEGTTDITGVVRLDVEPKQGPIRITIRHPKFTREVGTIQLG